MDNTYLPRLIRDRVVESLADTPVVCLLGPRQVGKTTLAQRIDPERAYLNLDEPTLLAAAQQDPLGFIENLPERSTLDEVQRAPELLLAIKSVVDRDPASRAFSADRVCQFVTATQSSGLFSWPYGGYLPASTGRAGEARQ